MGRGWGDQVPGPHIAKRLSSNPAPCLPRCVTSLSESLHLFKTLLSFLWVNKEVALPQRVVGMLKWGKARQHLAQYLGHMSA